MRKKPRHLKRMDKRRQYVICMTLMLGILFISLGFYWLGNPFAVAETVSRGVGVASHKDTTVLAKVISGEARGETYVGQVAVGAVIINRTRNPNFPNSVYGVVFEPGAFDAVKDGQYYEEATASSIKAAKDALNGWDPSNGAIYYWNPVTATSSWIWSRPIITRIGKHVFAK